MRGLAAHLRAQGLAVDEPRALTGDADQKAKLGRAVGLANELAGAGIATDLPTETQERRIEGATVILRRYPDPARAGAAAERLRREEAAHADAGKLAILAAGDMVLTVRGPGSGGPAAFPGAPLPRPASAPDPALVERLGTALAGFFGAPAP